MFYFIRRNELLLSRHSAKVLECSELLFKFKSMGLSGKVYDTRNYYADSILFHMK